MTLPPGTRLGDYEILGLLGVGGMGQVYLATDSRLQRRVALKLLPPEVAVDPQRRARFEREARLAAALQHPYICTIHEIGNIGGQLFIAMEYVEGQTLDRASLPVDRVIAAGIEIADALDAAHRHGIVHRDLKTANLILTPRGDVKILDFGVARRVEAPAGPDAMTVGGISEAGALIGTPGSMSPEQALGKDVDHRSDLFSFGVVLYELLTGRAPFRGPTFAAVLDAVLHETPPPISRFSDAVPDALVRIVAKLLEKDREARYQSAREVFNDLRRLQHEPPSAVTAAAPLAATRQRVAPIAVGLAVAIVTLAGMAAFWARARGRAPAGTPSIVVLPAEISGPASTANFEYLKDAVPATLSSRLSAIEGLETKVPPTVIEWEAAKHDVQQVVHAYAVQYYLSPHVYAEPGRLAMTLQLVQADTRKMIWSRDYSGTPAGYQTLIGSAADDLRGVLRPSAPRAPGSARDSAPELAFQEGHYFWNRYNTLHMPEDFGRAHAALERALSLDPGNAEAAAELAFLYEFKFEAGAPVADMVPEIQRWTKEALRIDPRNGLAHAALADMEIFKPVSDGAAMLHNALKAAFYAPRMPLCQNLLGIALGGGSADLAIVAQQQSMSLDPFYRAAIYNVVGALYLAGRSAEAITLVDQAIARQPELVSVRSTKFEPLLDLGRIDEAQTLVNQDGTHWSPWVLRVRQAELIDVRHDPRGLSTLRAVAASATDLKTLAEFASLTSRLAPFLARQGHSDEVVLLLQGGLAEHNWTPPYDVLVGNNWFAAARQHPRFTPIVDRSKAVMTAMLAVLEEARQNGELPAYLVGPLADLRARFGV